MLPELNILLRDQWIIAIEKPAGITSCPGGEPATEGITAMKILRDQIGAKVWPIHRLDRPTSGILLFGLSGEVSKHLRKLFDHQQIEKTYTAVVVGKSPDKWISETELQKAEDKPLLASKTSFEQIRLIEIGDDIFSVVRAEPATGRFHQIRKHLSTDGMPIVGDYLYGKVSEMDRIAKSTGQSRMMLHANYLAFSHPANGEAIHIDSPLPDRFTPFK